jgi:hypothetical protein
VADFLFTQSPAEVNFFAFAEGREVDDTQSRIFQLDTQFEQFVFVGFQLLFVVLDIQLGLQQLFAVDGVFIAMARTSGKRRLASSGLKISLRCASAFIMVRPLFLPETTEHGLRSG